MQTVFNLGALVMCVSFVFCAVQSTAGNVEQSEKRHKVQEKVNFSYDYTSVFDSKTGSRITVDEALSSLMSTLPAGVTTKLMYPDNPSLVVSDTTGILFELPHGMSTGYVDSIIIRSPEIKNDEGIGVGTDVDMFLRTYPFAKLYYTPDNQGDNTLWLNNGVGDTAFELVHNDQVQDVIKNVPSTSNTINLDPQILPKDATIDAINISGRAFDYHHHMGEWKSADKTVYLNLFETDNQPYYNLIIGNRILNQYDGKLIAVLDTLYSEPSGYKYHVVLSPANGDTPDGTSEMTLTLTPHRSRPSERYVLFK